MKVKKYSTLFRILDFLMIPLMFTLSGFHFESPMETHKWHMQTVDPKLVTDNKGVKIMGDDNSKYTNKTPLNHMPIFGGWKSYIILEAGGFKNYWNLGWKVKYIDSIRPEKCEIHKLQIKSSRIKVLKGLPDSEKIFFGLDQDGKYINLTIVGSGRLGDGKFRNVRLF